MPNPADGQYSDSGNLQARATLHARFAATDWFNWVANQLAFGEGECILDIGCGPAWLWRSLVSDLPDGLSLTLVDRSKGMLREAQGALSAEPITMSARMADASHLPYANNSFDKVLLMHVLYHVDDPRTALAEARRVLRPGGQVYVTTNALNNMQELNALGARAFGGSGDDRGAARFSLDDAAQMMAAIFAGIHRTDLEDVLACNEPDTAIGYLLSMPPGNTAPPDQRAHLADLVRAAISRGRGTLSITRRTGLISGIKT